MDSEYKKQNEIYIEQLSANIQECRYDIEHYTTKIDLYRNIIALNEKQIVSYEKSLESAKSKV